VVGGMLLSLCTSLPSLLVLPHLVVGRACCKARVGGGACGRRGGGAIRRRRRAPAAAIGVTDVPTVRHTVNEGSEGVGDIRHGGEVLPVLLPTE